MKLAGQWRIVDMQLCDADDLDLMGPAFIEFSEDLSGRFGFVAVDGWLDCREVERAGHPGVEFSWVGSDEGDEVSGRGWAALIADDVIEGRIFFHAGDDSSFRAVRSSEL